MFSRPRTSLIIVVLLLIVPQSIFVFGDYLVMGIRFPLFRYQMLFLGLESGPGNSTETQVMGSLITVVREIRYIFSGNIGGVWEKTAVATYIWLCGLVFLVTAATLVVSWQVYGNSGHARYPGPLLILTGFFFLVWAMVQFGPLLSGPSGYSIPVGVPLLWYVGYRFMQAAKGMGGAESGK